MQLPVSPSPAPSTDGSTESNSNIFASNRESIRKWMNKLISLINRVIEKGLANPITFRHSVNKVIEELLEDTKLEGDQWALDYFLFRVYESIWTGDQKSPKFGEGPVSATHCRFEEPCGLFKHLHLRPFKYETPTRFGIDDQVFEAVEATMNGNDEAADSLDTLMEYVRMCLRGTSMPLSPLSTWLDTKPVSSSPASPAEPQEKSLMERLNSLYLHELPKVLTKKGYKAMPPWSVPMPWNFDKDRDIYGNSAALPLYLQGMTIRIDWPTYSIGPVLTRAQERSLEETSPDMEMAKLHMLSRRMLFACARLNDWVRHMDEVRQVKPLHLFLAETVPDDNLVLCGYNSEDRITAGYKAWRKDPAGYLECIRPSDLVDEDGDLRLDEYDEDSSSASNSWGDEEDCARSEAHLSEED